MPDPPHPPVELSSPPPGDMAGLVVDGGAGRRGVFARGVRLLVASVRIHPLPFSVAVAGAALFATMSVGSTIVLGRVTDDVIIPAFREPAGDRSGHLVTGGAILGAALAILGVAVLRAIGVVGRRFFGGMTSSRMRVTWRRRITDVYLAAPLAFHQSRPTGELMAHADMDTEGATDVINPVPFSLSAIVIALAAVVRLAMVDPVLTVVGLTLFPLLALMNRVYTAKVEEPAALVQARYGDLAGVAHESFDGAMVVKTLGLADHEVGRLATAAADLRRERLRVGTLRASFEPALDLLPSLGVIALVAFGSWRVSGGAVSTGQLVEAMALFGVLSLPMRVLGYLLEEMPRAVVSVDRLEAVLATEAEVQPNPTSVEELQPGPLAVSLSEVTFGYTEAVPVLEGITISIAPGEVVAVAGATGAGKSTLCHLMAGLVEPAQGVVTLGGVDVRRIERTELRSAVAVVFQETFLFADAVAENLALDRTVSAAEVAWATDVTRAAAFVEALPHGIDTVIGERGVTLSGGQRQRLALARALLRRPRLLILDDATAAVDPRIEQQILAGLRAELEMTTVVVAHRVSTIALADRVVFLDAGRVVAVGTHAELLDREPGYQALVRAYEVAETEPDEAEGDLLTASGAHSGDDRQ